MQTAKHYENLEYEEFIAGDRQNLSPREQAALVHAANDLDGERTAEVMGVQRSTVYKFLESCQIKLNAHHKYRAVAVAVCRGIIRQAGYVRSPGAFIYSLLVGVALSFSVSVLDAEYGRPRPARTFRVRTQQGRKD